MKVRDRMAGVALLVCAASWAACAGVAAPTDWQSRVGRFSLNEVKRELGPPESCTGLDDGGTACSWTTSKTKDWIDKLVMTFDPSGQLATVNKVRL